MSAKVSISNTKVSDTNFGTPNKPSHSIIFNKFLLYFENLGKFYTITLDTILVNIKL